MALPHLASPSFLSPLLSSRKPSVISAASPSPPVFPQILTSKTPMISVSSPGSRHHSNLHPLRCCTTPESSSTVKNPPSFRIFIKGMVIQDYHAQHLRDIWQRSFHALEKLAELKLLQAKHQKSPWDWHIFGLLVSKMHGGL